MFDAGAGAESAADGHIFQRGDVALDGVEPGLTLAVEAWDGVEKSARVGVQRVGEKFLDRRAFDRIIQAGGYVSVNTGSAPDANSIPISKEVAEAAFDAAQCIGCGACVAACPNASAMLFVAAKAAQLARLPQGQPERLKRSIHMVEAMDREGFGNCSNHYECEAVCPKEIPVQFIAELNRDFFKAAMISREFSPLPPPVEIEE